MRFLLDEDVAPGVAEIARRRGVEFESVHEIDRRGYSDEDQLRFAAKTGRVLVTRNRDDFIRLTVSFFHEGAAHAGVLILPWTIPNRRPARVARALEEWLANRDDDPRSLRYLVDFL